MFFNGMVGRKAGPLTNWTNGDYHVPKVAKEIGGQAYVGEGMELRNKWQSSCWQTQANKDEDNADLSVSAQRCLPDSMNVLYYLML
jgi:hypothetical protein